MTLIQRNCGRFLAALAVLALLACPSKPRTPEPELPGGGGDAAKKFDSSLLPEPLATPLPSDPMAATIHRLDNGLTVYISTDRTTPRISSWIAVRAGSRHDPAASTGLAHYLEHMLFKGSAKLGTADWDSERKHIDRIAELYDQLRGASGVDRQKILAEIDSETQKSAAHSVPNEFDNLYASIGIIGVNAFTSDEQTVYICDVPKNYFETWAEVEGDRFKNPVFRLFYPELEAVYEEKNRSLDSPFSRVFEALLLGLYPQHPYGTQPTIGHARHLKSPAYGDMEAYYKRWYVPNNMAIVLAGDIDAETALPVLERHFGGLEPAPLSDPEPGAFPPLGGRVERRVVAEGEESVFIAWPTVPVLHEDRAALEVMDLLMDNARTGLLNVHLVLNQELPDAGSGAEFLNESGFWFMSGTARDGQSVEDVEQKLMGVLARLKAGDFSDEDLEAIVTNEEITLMQRLESNDSRVSLMTHSFVHRQPWPDVVENLERLRSVTRDDVIGVANRYLGEGRVVVQRRSGRFDPPKIDKPKITAVPIDPGRQSPYARELAARDVPPLEPVFLEEGRDYVRTSGAAGPVVAVPNPRNGLFSLSYSFDIGERQQPLLCHAIDVLEASGAGEISAEELQRKLYALGTEVDLWCGTDVSAIRIEGLDRNLDQSLALVKQWLESPRFDPETVKKLTANTLSARKDQMEEPLGVAAALHDYASRDRESPYLVAPPNKRIASASAKTLASLIRAWPNHEHRTSYFGPRDPSRVGSELLLGARHKKVAPLPPRRYRKLRQPTVYFADKSAAQSQVQVVYPGKVKKKEDLLLSEIYNQYVGGGMGALVFQEIREARGLAYSAGASYQDPGKVGDQVAVAGRIGTQVDKTVEAVKVLGELLVGFEVDAQRLETARRGVEASLRNERVEPRWRASQIYSWERRGLEGDPRRKIFAGLAGVTGEELQAFARGETQNPPIIAIMGDARRLPPEALKELGELIVVPVTKIFSYDD